MTKPLNIELIPIDSIVIVNPRIRNAKMHESITENISLIGLKRPITVRRMNANEGGKYALVCGQGRLESFQLLGQKEVPAIIVDVDQDTGYVMSLVENIARRPPRASEMLDHISVLRDRGYSDAEIGKKTGYTSTWISNVLHLLDKGERKLLSAVEAKHIPLHLAVEISRSNDADIQQLLLDAYDRGELKGKKVSIARRIIDQRSRSGKTLHLDTFGSPKTNKKLSVEELTKLYEADTAKHKLIQKKAERAQATILLAKQIFKELYENQEFSYLLANEGLNNIPKPLAFLVNKSDNSNV